jgi:multimeric flavodoxin WrbA
VSRDAVRVLCIAGSPRRHGASELLLDACIEGVEGAGGIADQLVVAELDIAPCRGCNACSDTGACTVRDDMDDVYPRVDAADAILVASPVYFASVPAGLKALYDRCQPYWARVYVLGHPRPPRRPGAMLFVRGGGDPYGFDGATLTTRSVFAVLGLDVVGQLLVDDVDNPSELLEQPETFELARQLGSKLVAEVLRSRD